MAKVKFFFTGYAREQFKKLDKGKKRQIVNALEAMSKPKRLQDDLSDFYSLKTIRDTYRILFAKEKSNIVSVAAVGKRKPGQAGDVYAQFAKSLSEGKG